MQLIIFSLQIEENVGKNISCAHLELSHLNRVSQLWSSSRTSKSVKCLKYLNFCDFIQDPRDFKQFNENQIDTKAKRPFCNAFTGCGRKRSNEVARPQPPQLPTEDEEEANIAELLDLNSEPAIENLMRQIMSEAKMYEAIQEANREMYLLKLKHAYPNRAAPSTFSMQ